MTLHDSITLWLAKMLVELGAGLVVALLLGVGYWLCTRPTKRRRP